MTAEQRVANTGFGEMYFLAFPKAAVEELHRIAHARGQSVAQGMSEAISDWIKKGSTDE